MAEQDQRDRPLGGAGSRRRCPQDAGNLAERARAIDTRAGATTVAMLVGPVLGGVFVDTVSWRLVFLINVLPIAVTLVLLARFSRTGVSQRREHGAVDGFGALLCTLGLGLGAFALIGSDRIGWHRPAIYLPAAAAVALLSWFVAHQRTATHPMLPLALFAVRNF